MAGIHRPVGTYENLYTTEAHVFFLFLAAAHLPHRGWTPRLSTGIMTHW